MTTKTTITDFSRHLSDYINRVAYGGERLILSRGGKALAEVKAVRACKTMSDLPAMLAALPSLSEADAFETDLQEIRNSVGPEAATPWDA